MRNGIVIVTDSEKGVRPLARSLSEAYPVTIITDTDQGRLPNETYSVIIVKNVNQAREVLGSLESDKVIFDLPVGDTWAHGLFQGYVAGGKKAAVYYSGNSDYLPAETKKLIEDTRTNSVAFSADHARCPREAIRALFPSNRTRDSKQVPEPAAAG